MKWTEPGDSGGMDITHILSHPVLATGFYVADSFAASRDEALIAGPFTDRASADEDRRERNIADDCFIVRVTR